MAPTTSTSKRKRSGADMPKLREVLDEDTGKIIQVRIETTKQAKKRHQKSGGAQWKPTTGQINAADIWNKQEEKIKRDREREEKRRRNAVRMAEKEAKAKEQQEELLRKGKITVEDTWGKVSASQNRLNRFFGAPRQITEILKPDIKRPDIGGRELDPPDTSQSNEQNPQVLNLHHPQSSDHCIDDDIDEYLTNSPLTQRSPPPKPLLHVDRKSAAMDAKPQALMLPPPPPKFGGSYRRDLSFKGKDKSGSDTILPQEPSNSKVRSPLSEMSHSELNIRAQERPDLELDLKNAKGTVSSGSALLSTQVVSHMLEGLGSQDFKDDFAEGKENTSPTRKAHTSPLVHLDSTSFCNRRSETSPLGHKKSSMIKELNRSTQAYGDTGTDTDTDDFDDDDIDDDILMSLAATQRIRQHAAISPSKHVPSSPFSVSTVKLSQECNGSPIAKHVGNPSKFSLPAVGPGDSFAFTDIDDADLLRCIDDFENGGQNDQSDNDEDDNDNDEDMIKDDDLLKCMEDFESEHENSHSNHSSMTRPAKKRRVLPWVKYPVEYSAPSFEEPVSASPSFEG